MTMRRATTKLVTVWLLAGCGTRLNPDFCDSNEDCNNGTFCNLSNNRCEMEPDAPPDAGVDGSTARCNPASEFQAAVHEPSLSSSLDDEVFSMTSDEKLVIFQRQSPYVMLMASRFNRDEPFSIVLSPPELEAIRGVSGDEYHPGISSDGLALYFHRSDQAAAKIFVASRAEPNATFSSGNEVSVDGSTLQMIYPQLSRDGQRLYWFDYGGAERKVYVATRTSASVFMNRTAATTFQVGRYVVSADELTLYYSDPQNNDIFRSIRPSKDTAFPVGVPVGNINSNTEDGPLAVSDDDCVLYLQSKRVGGLGGYDLYVARRGP